MLPRTTSKALRSSLQRKLFDGFGFVSLLLSSLLVPPPLDGFPSPQATPQIRENDSPAIDQEASPRPRDAAKKQRPASRKTSPRALQDAKHRDTGEPEPFQDPELERYAIYERTAPRPQSTEATRTALPLALRKGDRVAFIGNTLLERAQHFGYFETLLHQRHGDHRLVVRNLSWPADTVDLQPRPDNFADLEQHLMHERADVIFAAFGFNESFAGADGLARFRQALIYRMAGLQAKTFNGKSGPRIVLLSPLANENVLGVQAADLNNARLESYTEVMKSVAAEQGIGFVDLFHPTRRAMARAVAPLTFNGVHLTAEGYAVFAAILYRELFSEEPPVPDETLREVVVEKNRQYFRRYRPLNTFYYTGGRKKSFGYLDFLPAMRNFDILVANRDQRIWALAAGEEVPTTVNDDNVQPMPRVKQSRGANEWLSARDELKAFRVDPRFEVKLFAGEEDFPDLAAPIQMRWDAAGRLWVSCSTTYPHVYPGQEPNDKLIILEDSDGDGQADTSSVFADDLHIPLSFEFGDGGVYVSEQPHLTFIQDTDGDGRADVRRRVLTGFGSEDSHHSLHDFVWSPDGALLLREGIFHHTQVETPYGPVRQANSGWFRFEPRSHRVTSFGSYSSTNPWGVTFDHWGQHVASHPIFASAFHALDPPYPKQHPRPTGLRAYSGTCGQEFVDFASFPDELQGAMIKVRYKPTNRVEIHRWKEYAYGYDEDYVGDLLFSENLSFIPVDVRFGPHGALYVCDWYNPVKGHAQYSLRDERRDRHSGRIWRITTKGKELVRPPKIAGAAVEELLEILERPEYRYRYWAKRELRERDAAVVADGLKRWLSGLDERTPGYRHHQIEALWMYRGIGKVQVDLLRELLACDSRHARAAATRQLRYWHANLPEADRLLRRAANDSNGLVRLEAVIAASYVGNKPALDAVLDAAKHPHDKHLNYAIACSLGSHTLRDHWENDSRYADVPRLLARVAETQELVEKPPDASQARFDAQQDLLRVEISCLPERMRYSVERFTVKPDQPVKLIFSNPDATDHNLVIVRPDALEEVGIAANDMAKDPRHANSDFIPAAKKHLILGYARMIGPSRSSRIYVLRFRAPKEPGVYPYVCTFPGHWVVMTGEMIVARDPADVDALLSSRQRPSVVQNWKVGDFSQDTPTRGEPAIMRGMKAFLTARCNQCHAVGGHGAKFGPDLTKVAEKYHGARLLEQILEPSKEVNEQYRTYQLVLKSGEVLTGTILKEDETSVHVIPNLLLPDVLQQVPKKDILQRVPAQLSSMPQGLADVLTKKEVLDLLTFLEAGGYQLPAALKHGRHSHR